MAESESATPNSNSLKRPRLSTSGVAEQLEDRCDADFYFKDGNVVLSAKSAEGGAFVDLYRVHQSILVQNSSFWADMFSLPQPVHQDMYDGVPRVDVPETSASLKGYLAALYNPCFPSTNSRTFFSELIRIEEALDLATKYGADALRDHIFGLFSSLWPRTLNDWDERMARFPGMYFSQDMPRIIRISRRHKLANILPSAYFQYYHAFAYTGVEHGHARAAQELDKLDKDDLITLIWGQQKLAEYLNKRINLGINFAGHLCSNDDCRQQMAKTWEDELRVRSPEFNILETLLDCSEYGLHWNDMCPRCCEKLRFEFKAIRTSIWDEIIPESYTPLEWSQEE